MFFHMTFNLYSRTIDVDRVNGGENGYQYVSEHHEEGGWFSSSKSKLSCTDPGQSDCSWNIHPSTLPDMISCGDAEPIDDAVTYAEAQILSGNLSGSKTDYLNFGCGQTERIISWTSTSNDLTNSHISVQFNSASQ